MEIINHKSLENFFSYLGLRKAAKFCFYYEDQYRSLAETIHKVAPSFGLQILPVEINAATVTNFIDNIVHPLVKTNFHHFMETI